MVLGMRMTGIRATSLFLVGKKTAINMKLQKGLSNAAFFLEGEIKQSIAGHRAEPRSVDTGQFLNSVTTNVGKTDVRVLSDVGHAEALEFGTTRMVARAHFRNSKARNKDKIKEILNVEIKKI